MSFTGLENLGAMPKPLSKSSKPDLKRLKLNLSKTKKWKSGHLKLKVKIEDNYDIIKPLGAGTYASVSLATDLTNEKKVAIKISRKENSCEKLASEYKILSELDHECIIKPIRFINNEMKNEAFLVLEYFEGTDIKEFVQKNGPLSNDGCKRVIQQLSSCVSYLHSKGIAHRDIKPENVLIDEELNIKLIDFNISKKMKSGSDDGECKFRSIFYTQISSPLYAAPEIKERCLYTESVDIWGIGIIMFTCFYGCPTSKSDSGKALNQISLSDIIESESSVCKEAQVLLLKLLCKDPQLRLSAEEILADDFLN
ncbi:unnamed protein product [Moneuplotes crassus]|uniref:Protein kinase domain-containing protein n=1 Tax=Euplotes crassus TaxID=5936 RepID=A0AAD2DA08_EUPCR|nr:unnamed protein product [Moneuplotes crassus]